MYSVCSIPPQVANKFKDMLIKHHVVDMMVTTPYIHIYYSSDNILRCESKEDLSKHVSVFENIINFYKNK